ncbi:MAG: ribbon-helix-helix protein, CopG family [Acidobacteria bacterium]|nr:ribbon-helix-helix protein, CopG family [Acidobacteriota bacterium]MBP8273661.1 ribbon-helix-helix protein, CopG family [Acidobacteriota bacterium]
MIRLQVQLSQAQHRQVKRRARDLGVSVSEVIRRSVDTMLDASDETPDQRVARALAAAGRYHDPKGRTHTATEHDAALVESYRS